MHNINVEILVNGSRCKVYKHNNKFYLESKNNSQYSIKVKNDNYFKVGAAVSVDGLNIINGEPAGNKDPLYILDNYNSIELKGFRVDNDSVAAFKFGKKEKSYATETQGNEAQNGVIAVRVYKEKELNLDIYKDILENDDFPNAKPSKPLNPNPWMPPYRPYPYDKPYWYYKDEYSSTGMEEYKARSKSIDNNESHFLKSCAINCSQNGEFDSGTFWGPKTNSPIKEVEFKRGDLLTEIVIYYATRAELEKMGVEFHKKQEINFPNAFPADSKFCKKPKNWD